MINLHNPNLIEYNTFIQGYVLSPKNVIFWDTCSLLDLLRLTYRDGNLDAFKVYENILNKIQSNDILSVASEISIQECQDNYLTIEDETNLSLQKTETYHKNAVKIINYIKSRKYASSKLSDKGMVMDMERILNEILERTYFLKITDIALSALNRVIQKKPPAGKKQEFKDCAVWESFYLLSRTINSVDTIRKQVFFSTNKNDFLDKSRTPYLFHPILTSEVISFNARCCINIDEVNSEM